MSSIVFGIWPLAGITSGIVAPDDARDTIRAAFEAGIDTFDTAFSYGYEGEAEAWLGDVIRERRFFRQTPPRVMGKVSQRWTADRRRYVDASPAALIRDAEQSLRRLRIERFDWLLLHSVDPNVDLRRSAEALDSLRRRELASSIGISNPTIDELNAFASVVPCAAIQCMLNLLQRDTLDPLLATAHAIGADGFVYWALMKGLLAGRISPDHVFAEGDSRPNYAVFQGEARRKAHAVVDELKRIAAAADTTPARLAIGWALAQTGVTGVLVGAKTPDQIRETALAMPLAGELLAQVDALAL